MNIQLYIPKSTADDTASQTFVETLRESLQERDDVCLVSRDPDLIHVLGTRHESRRKAAQATQRLVPTLLTTLGQLTPWMSSRATMHALQKTTLTTLHVWSPTELQQTAKNQKVELIANAATTARISRKEMIDSIVGLYKEAIERHDNNIRKQLREQTSQATEPDQPIGTLMQETLYCQYRFRRGTLKLEHLNSLTRLLTQTDYDEDLFAEVLAKLQVQPFFTNAEQVMSEVCGLTEGFMPTPPADKHIAQQLRKLIGTSNL